MKECRISAKLAPAIILVYDKETKSWQTGWKGLYNHSRKVWKMIMVLVSQI